jgi:hypothetical protein
MKIYNYHADSGQLIGESIADADPLHEGQWLIPAHATTIEPPQTTDKQFAAFDDVNWVVFDIPEAVEPEPAPEPTYQQLRAMEYPPMADYLDGIVKGDTEQVDAYISACLDIKAKYPKT